MQIVRLLAVLAYSHLIVAYLTHGSMRKLTVLTDDLRERIVDIESSGEQRVLGGGEDSEIVSFATPLSIHLCSSLAAIFDARASSSYLSLPFRGL